jgi:hypothetical protein
MTTPVKDLPESFRNRFKGRDLTETDECFDTALRIAANELEASLAAQDDELERLRGALEEAMSWNWLDGDVPEEIAERLDTLSIPPKHKLGGGGE